MRKQTIRTRALRTLGACALSAALLLAAGCVEDLGLSPASGAGDRTLGIEMEGGMTKVAVDDGTTGALSWTTGDAIAVYVAGTGGTPGYQTPTVDVDNKTVTVSLTGEQEINYYSVYPAASKVDAYFGNSELRVIYPATYTVPSGLAAAQQNLWSPMPMVAWNTEGGVVPGGTPKTSLMFYHVGGVLRIKLTNVPTTATSCTVTFVGMEHVTGTYKVGNPGTTTANTDTRVTGTNNVVTFNFAAGQAERWINVPLPTGDYSSLTAVTIASGGKSVTKASKWYLMRHGQGRRIDADLNAGTTPGPLTELNIGSLEDVTLWKGQSITRTAQACDNNGTVISGATITWASSNTTVATVDNTGKVTTNAAGTTTLTATASYSGNTATASYKVHVNEITGLTLDRSSMTLRVGETGTLAATATYTHNGDWESISPKVNWSVSPAGRVTFAKTATESGVANTVRGATSGDGTITATIPAGTYGTNDEFVKTCSITVFPRNVIPGAFSVSPTEQVYFAPGNLVVKNTLRSGVNEREWLFEENQWDISHSGIDPTNGYSVEGQTYWISHFGWATAGHKNPAGDYGYDENHLHYEPSATIGENQQHYRYGPSSASWTQSWGGNDPDNTWNANPEMAKYCEWGVHFDDAGVGYDDKYDGKTWFTLSDSQWTYLLETRAGAMVKRAHASIVVDNAADIRIHGLVILPDDWQCPAGCTYHLSGGDNSYNPYYSYLTNIYYADTTWPLMEAAGAVFLPVGGYRSKNSMEQWSTNNSTHGFPMPGYTWGHYWSSSMNGVSQARNVAIPDTGGPRPNSYDARNNGYMVRLARYAN